MNIDEELEHVVDFIKTGLKPKDKIFDYDEDNIIHFENEIEPDSFSTFDKLNRDYKIAAIDGGSSIVLNGASFIVGIYRAGYSIFQNNRKFEDLNPLLKVKLISLLNKDEIYLKEYLKIIGEPPKKPAPDISWLVQRLRIFEEWKNIQELIEKLDKDDIIIYDGALKADIALPDSLLEKATKDAFHKGIILVGISKRSSMYSNHAPISILIKKHGDNIYPKKRWFFQVSNIKKEHLFGKTYFVKYNPLSRFVFRTDINFLEKENPEKIFGRISSYCNDPSYLGYPYPLASVHNKVVIDSETKKTFEYKLQSIALEKGIPLSDWDYLFLNFHDILDRSF